MKNTKNKLTIELVPKKNWYFNVRSEVSKERWDELRKDCYKKAGYKCEICGGKGDKWPVECHEVWEYKKGVQKLIRLIALCPSCHEVKHIGLAQIKGNYERALGHLMRVNQMTKEEAQKNVEKAFEEWKDRNNKDYSLDITFLEK